MFESQVTTATGAKRLHWNQKVALIRHNLHAARRTGDFTFFKTLQAHAFLEGTDYVAALNDVLGDEADTVLTTLDNLNAGIAYVHQDAFKNVFDKVKATMISDSDIDSRMAIIRVDMSQQKQMADFAIDRMASSVTQLIQAQPAAAQEAIANAWVMGTTIIVDAVKVSLDEIDGLEQCMADFIRLEYSWSTVQSSVDAAVSALRGIFNLMANSDGSDSGSPRTGSVASTTGPISMFRRLSTALSTGGSGGRSMSITSNSSNHSHSSPTSIRASISAACPTSMPARPPASHAQIAAAMGMSQATLSPIPPTPAVMEVNPFEMMSEDGDRSYNDGTTTPQEHDIAEIDNIDPLSKGFSNNVVDCRTSGREEEPSVFRRISNAFAAPPPIAV